MLYSYIEIYLIGIIWIFAVLVIGGIIGTRLQQKDEEKNYK